MTRRALLAVIVPVSLAVTGVAGASMLAPPPDPSPAPPTPPGLMRSADDDAPEASKDDPKDAADEGAGIHGGPIERTHDAAGCNLVSVGGLPGNWTHGDYVSAVAALGDPALVPIAAQSDCGKPVQAGGPPAFAGTPDHAGGPPEHAGSPDDSAAPADAGPSQGS